MNKKSIRMNLGFIKYYLNNLYKKYDNEDFDMIDDLICINNQVNKIIKEIYG